LVRFEWVASNVSEARVYVMAFHLVNTFLLLAAMTLTAWFAGRGGPLERGASSGLAAFSASALLAVLAVGASGAVTALGDTLVFTAGIDPGDSPLVAKLVASRFYHPTTALLAFAAVAGAVLWLRPPSRKARVATVWRPRGLRGLLLGRSTSSSRRRSGCSSFTSEPPTCCGYSWC
jgi:heme A synthase